jgi:hypothetical protein
MRPRGLNVNHAQVTKQPGSGYRIWYQYPCILPPEGPEASMESSEIAESGMRKRRQIIDDNFQFRLAMRPEKVMLHAV